MGESSSSVCGCVGKWKAAPPSGPPCHLGHQASGSRHTCVCARPPPQRTSRDKLSTRPIVPSQAQELLAPHQCGSPREPCKVMCGRESTPRRRGGKQPRETKTGTTASFQALPPAHTKGGCVRLGMTPPVQPIRHCAPASSAAVQHARATTSRAPAAAASLYKTSSARPGPQRPSAAACLQSCALADMRGIAWVVEVVCGVCGINRTALTTTESFLPPGLPPGAMMGSAGQRGGVASKSGWLPAMTMRA